VKTILAEAVGWYGAVAIVAAYALVSFGVMTADSVGYQLLNFTGAIGVIVISLVKGAKQPAVLNIFWAIIALIAIVQLLI